MKIASSPPKGLAPILTASMRFSRTSFLGSWNSGCAALHQLTPQSNLDVGAKSKDSMGHEEVLKRGDIQMTSAGTGIQHSEGCYGDEPVHFLQIWAFPSQKGLEPRYFTRHFSDEEKRDRFVKVVGPVNSSGISLGRNDRGPTPIHAPLNVYATLLSPGRTAHRLFSITSNSKAYVHHIQRSGYQPGNVTSGGTIVLNTDTTLREGDGSFVWVKTEQGRLSVTNTGSTPAEVLLFEMP